MKEAFNPIPLILDQFFLAVKQIRQFKGTPDEERFCEIAKHLEKELRKELIR